MFWLDIIATQVTIDMRTIVILGEFMTTITITIIIIMAFAIDDALVLHGSANKTVVRERVHGSKSTAALSVGFQLGR